MNQTVIIVIVISVIFAILCIPYAKRQRRLACNKLEPLLSDPKTAKVALWIDLDMVNGHIFTGEFHYWSDVQKELFNNENPVGVALFAPGKYYFTVSSQQHKEVGMFVELLAGQTYQLGCNGDGPYLVIDAEPERYNYKYKDKD